MKTVVKGAIRDEKGNVLIMVLILLVVGGLILTPLLGLMSTGLLAGQVYERKMDEYYAADAGVEDALWKIKHGIEIPTDGYNLTVNDKYVWVTVDGFNTLQFLLDMLDLDKERNWPASDWVIIGKIPEPGKAEITINWTGSGNAFLENVGIWMDGTCSYVEEQVVPDGDVRTNTTYTFEEKAYSGGTAFIWEWPKKGPQFNKDRLTAVLTFSFDPEVRPERSIAFTYMVRQNVGLSYDDTFEESTITATAISDTGTATADITSHTTIVARAVRQSCPVVEIEVLNWNIS